MARDTLTLFIDLEGDATQNAAEVADLLRQAARKIAPLHDVDEGWIKYDAVGLIDSNGNRVGEFYIEER
jgi:hypothetical protein